jgi:carboxyl-terminal processing protease
MIKDEAKKLNLWLPALLAMVMVCGMYAGYKLKERTGSGDSFLVNNKQDNLDEVLDIINYRYVDSVNIDSLERSAISNILEQLDPHSVFIPPSDLTDVNEDLKGSFKGIGVEFQIFNDTVHIVNIVDGGPSVKAGLMIGDKIIKANDTTIVSGKNLNSDMVRQILKGPAGSKVILQIMRDNKMIKKEVERGVIPVPSLAASYLISPKKGFIKLNRFSETTYEEFMQALEQLQALGMQSLILDLRNNPGGLMEEAIDIADEFLSGDKLIVYTKGSKFNRTDYRCKRDGLFEEGKLIILIDEGSASASEILAGAVQDWDRGLIIGRRSFGKGLVQQQFNLTGGSALRLTIQRYYTPLGRHIQKPYKEGLLSYQNEIQHRYDDGEIFLGKADTTKGPIFTTPRGNRVYGGGGITPDVFIPADTVKEVSLLASVYGSNLLSKSVYRFYISHKAMFAERFKTPRQFGSTYQPADEEWAVIEECANQDSVSINNGSEAFKKHLFKQFKYLMARQIWRSEGYTEVSNLDDPVIKIALGKQ